MIYATLDEDYDDLLLYYKINKDRDREREMIAFSKLNEIQYEYSSIPEIGRVRSHFEWQPNIKKNLIIDGKWFI